MCGITSPFYSKADVIFVLASASCSKLRRFLNKLKAHPVIGWASFFGSGGSPPRLTCLLILGLFTQSLNELSDSCSIPRIGLQSKEQFQLVSRLGIALRLLVKQSELPVDCGNFAFAYFVRPL